jgi:RNA polymerase sigma factor (sigma-70 family)
MSDGRVRSGVGILDRLLHEIAETGAGGDTPDGELLRRFTTGCDQSAFRTLVRRHAPMVFRVCLGVLRREQDAEDAFQATFLVLAKKAAEVRKAESVGSWLFGVAHRVSMKLKTAAARRRAHEHKVERPPAADPLAELTVREAQQLLDEELARLPERFRAPLILCCIEGLTRDEAAKQLDWTSGALKSRLERARRLLRVRLTRRGLTVPAALLASLLGSTAKAVPSRLVDVVTGAGTGGAGIELSATAVAAADEMVRAMTLSKIKIAVAVLVAAVFIGAVVAAGVFAAEPLAPDVPVPVEQPKAKAPLPVQAPAPGVPPERWGVEFANAVTQVCELREDGTASVVELALPKYSGKVIDKDGQVLVEYTGDRTQRFTPVGERMVVEHWWPGAKKGTDRPVLGIAERVPKGTPGTLRYTDAARGFRLTVPADWAVVTASYPAHYRTAFLCLNSRGDRALRVQGNEPIPLHGPTRAPGRPGVEQDAARRLEPGTVYIDLGHIEFGPHPGGLLDSVGPDLRDLVRVLKPTKTQDGKLSEADLAFAKRQKHWHVHAYFREPVEDDVRAQALEVLRSIEFVDAKAALPVGRWSVEFAKGVPGFERDVRADGTFSLTLPSATSKGTPAPPEGGRAAVKDGSVVFTFDAGAVERWTPVGTRFVVESWPDGSKFPAAAPSVLGIAGRPGGTAPNPRGRAAEPVAQPREEPVEKPGEQQAAIAALKKLGGDVTPDRVSFRRVEVTDADLIHLKPLTGVTLVWFVGSTKVTDAGLEHFKGMKGLETAYLDDTGVGDAGLAHLKGMAKLTNLYLSGTKVGDPGLKQLKEMASLRVIYLDELKVTDAGLDHLAGLDQLKTLSLNGTKVTDAGLKKVAGLTKLYSLHLNDTAVTDDGLAHLKKLTNLRRLDLKGTKVTDAGIERLKEALPNCKIVHLK